jgi:hypothetical protein
MSFIETWKNPQTDYGCCDFKDPSMYFLFRWMRARIFAWDATGGATIGIVPLLQLV